MTDEEPFFDGKMSGFVILDEPATQEEIRQAAADLDFDGRDDSIEFENGSSIAYQSEKPEIEEPKAPPHEQRLPGEEPNMTLLNAVLQSNNRKIPLSVGGHVEIECRMSYDRFKRL